MYVYMYALCMYVCMYDAFIYVYLYVCMYVCMYICLYVCLPPFVVLLCRAVVEYRYLSQSSTSLDQYGSEVDCHNLVAVSNATTVFPPNDDIT